MHACCIAQLHITFEYYYFFLILLLLFYLRYGVPRYMSVDDDVVNISLGSFAVFRLSAFGLWPSIFPIFTKNKKV